MSILALIKDSILAEPQATADEEAYTLLGQFADSILRMCAATTAWHTRIGRPLSDFNKELVSLLADNERQRLSGINEFLMISTLHYLVNRDVKFVASAMEETRDSVPLIANHLRVISMSERQRDELVRTNQQGRDERIRAFRQRRALPAAASEANIYNAAADDLFSRSGKLEFMHDWDRIIPRKPADKNVPTRLTNLPPRASSSKSS